MTKMLRQVYGVWTSNTPFAPQHEAKKKVAAELQTPVSESPEEKAGRPPIDYRLLRDLVLCQQWLDGWPGLEGASPKPRGFLRSAQSSPGHPIHQSTTD